MEFYERSASPITVARGTEFFGCLSYREARRLMDTSH